MTFSGKLRYTLKNDYMFKAVFQENQTILKGFLTALLSLSDDQIKTVHVENPIILGTTIKDKDVCLDIRLTLNNNRLINLEMQVLYQSFWIQRSLSYLCRLYNQLKVGDSYSKACKVIQISIIDFQLFKDEHIFYSQNVLMDKKTYRIYSDNLALNVLSLKHIHNATQEDRDSGLYKWGLLFAAKTWEELKMLAKNDAVFKEVEATMETLSADEAVMDLCHMREYDRQMYAYEQKLHQEELEAAHKEAEKFRQEAEAARQEVEQLKALLAQYKGLPPDNKQYHN